MKTKIGLNFGPYSDLFHVIVTLQNLHHAQNSFHPIAVTKPYPITFISGKSSRPFSHNLFLNGNFLLTGVESRDTLLLAKKINLQFSPYISSCCVCSPTETWSVGQNLPANLKNIQQSASIFALGFSSSHFASSALQQSSSNHHHMIGRYVFLTS